MFFWSAARTGLHLQGKACHSALSFLLAGQIIAASDVCSWLTPRQLSWSLIWRHASVVAVESPSIWNEIWAWAMLYPTLPQHWPFTTQVKRGCEWSSRKGNSPYAEVEKKWLYIINSVFLQLSHAQRNVIMSDQTASSLSFAQPCVCTPFRFHAMLTISRGFF